MSILAQLLNRVRRMLNAYGQSTIVDVASGEIATDYTAMYNNLNY